MNLNRTLLSTMLATAFGLGAAGAQAQISDGVIKIGVMNDMSGLYADIAGPGSVTAAKMAVEDFGAEKKGMKVEIVSADHQNKPDVGSTVARTWYDVDKVDAIFDVPTSSVALAINQITQGQGQGLHQQRRGHVRPDRQGVQPEHGALDLRHLDAGQRHGQRDRRDRRRHLVLPHRRLRLRPCARARHHGRVDKAGGKVLGGVRVPFPGTDFSSFLLQAQASQRQGHRPGQCRRRHRQLDQAGARSSALPSRGQKPGRHADVPHRRARASA